MYEKEIHYIKERWSGQISARDPDFLPSLCALTQRRCMVGMFGMQSAGKSTLLNSFIGFPVLPSLVTKGTVRALTLEYGSRPLLLVYPDVMQIGKPIELTGIFPEELFQRMLEYVCRCVNETVFYPENINCFLSETKAPGSLTPEDLQLDPHDGRHGLLLVLILLNAYFTEADSRSNAEQRVNRERRALLLQAGIDPDTAFSLKLQWNSSMIPKDVCLIDLPGLGSQENSPSNSLSDLALTWARCCDILLCLTTGEAVGGLVHDALTEILRGTYADGSPQPVLIINKAELILSLETSRSAAKQMIPSLNTISYFLSSAAGEYCYLDSGITLERTQFWRHEFLPEFHNMKPGIEITRAERELALKKLRERFTKVYPCEKEDGTYTPVSLQSFLQQEFQALVQQCNLQIFRRVYTRDKSMASYIRNLVTKESSLLCNFAAIQKSMLDVWFSGAENAMGKLCEDLLGIEAAVSEIMVSHQQQTENFFQWWVETVKRISDHLSQSAISACDNFHSQFGFIRCSGDSPYTVDNSMKNDAYLKELYHKVMDFNINDILTQGYNDGANITVRTLRRAFEILQFIQLAISRFNSSVKALPESCREYFCIHGYHKNQFDFYFSSSMQKLSETLYYDVIPPPSDLLPTPPEPAEVGGWENPCWRSIQYEWLHHAIDSAVLTKNKKSGGILFKRKRLMKRLERPMISAQYAGELIAPLVEQKNTSAIFDYLLKLSHNCRFLHDRLTGSWNHKFDEYHKMADSLSQPLEDKVRRDYGLLRDIQCIIE